MQRAQALVAQMTLAEKASQLQHDSPAIPRLGIPAYNWWSEGLPFSDLHRLPLLRHKNDNADEAECLSALVFCW